MESKILVLNGTTIDYSKSSIEIFPAIKELPNSGSLYLKFSKNHIKTLAIEHHAELSLDFDLCLIDRLMNETIIQLFAIFAVTKDNEPLNDWYYVHEAIAFARSLVVDEIRERGLRDKEGVLIEVPAFTLHPESIDFSFSK
ncbi:MAG: hypothetical protein JWQ30_2805 [Sediminibacterium sp.]|nr:hypothetical protein [Sediminibacterium sp.]